MVPSVQLPRTPHAVLKAPSPARPSPCISHTHSPDAITPSLFAAAASNAVQVLSRAAKAAAEMEAMKKERVKMTQSYVDELALNGHLWKGAIDEHMTSTAGAMRDELRASALARGVSWKTT